MRNGAILSGVLHLTIFLVLVFGLPSFVTPLEVAPPIPVELVVLEEAPEVPEPEPEPVKEAEPEPEPEPEPIEQAKAPPPPAPAVEQPPAHAAFGLDLALLAREAEVERRQQLAMLDLV